MACDALPELLGELRWDRVPHLPGLRVEGTGEDEVKRECLADRRLRAR